MTAQKTGRPDYDKIWPACISRLAFQHFAASTQKAVIFPSRYLMSRERSRASSPPSLFMSASERDWPDRVPLTKRCFFNSPASSEVMLPSPSISPSSDSLNKIFTGKNNGLWQAYLPELSGKVSGPCDILMGYTH